MSKIRSIEMANIEFHGPPVLNAQGPFWTISASVPSGTSEQAKVLVKLPYAPDETFARKLGARYDADMREAIMKAFAEEKINEALNAGQTPPKEITIRVTDADADLALRRWDLLE